VADGLEGARADARSQHGGRARPDLVERDLLAVAERPRGHGHVEARPGAAVDRPQQADAPLLAPIGLRPPLHLQLGGAGQVVHAGAAHRRQRHERTLEQLGEEIGERAERPERAQLGPGGGGVGAQHERAAVANGVHAERGPRGRRAVAEHREVAAHARAPAEAGHAADHLALGHAVRGGARAGREQHDPGQPPGGEQARKLGRLLDRAEPHGVAGRSGAQRAEPPQPGQRGGGAGGLRPREDEQAPVVAVGGRLGQRLGHGGHANTGLGRRLATGSGHGGLGQRQH
jgi:hypothetical protein